MFLPFKESLIFEGFIFALSVINLLIGVPLTIFSIFVIVKSIEFFQIISYELCGFILYCLSTQIFAVITTMTDFKKIRTRIFLAFLSIICISLFSSGATFIKNEYLNLALCSLKNKSYEITFSKAEVDQINVLHFKQFLEEIKNVEIIISSSDSKSNKTNKNNANSSEFLDRKNIVMIIDRSLCNGGNLMRHFINVYVGLTFSLQLVLPILVVSIDIDKNNQISSLKK